MRTIFDTDELNALLLELETIEALRQPLRGVRDAQFNLYPSIPLSVLTTPGLLDHFFRIWEPWIPKLTLA